MQKTHNITIDIRPVSQNTTKFGSAHVRHGYN